MPQPDEHSENDGSNNKVSNMPLLFAGGYPTSLNKITESQLEKFIPFMVQCSLGYIHIHSLDEFREPEWWPKHVEFTKPFKKPKSLVGSWSQRMREIVVACYSFHDCVYLLRYCNDLASYQPTSLRFVNNNNSTTSLYDRASNKLLVTLRNENMLYDQRQKNSRKCLLPKQSNSQYNQATLEDMFISEGFHIYLCEYCDAELYSDSALTEHEKVCLMEQGNLASEEQSDDDDVIFCGEVFEEQHLLGSSARARTEQQKKQDFLSENFMLLSKNRSDGDRCTSFPIQKPKSSCADLESTATECSSGKPRRWPRRTRYVMTLARCPQIPLSSPFGESLLKSTKATCTEEYVSERLDRIERFCHAPPIPPGTLHLLREQSCLEQTVIALNRRLPKWLFNKPRPGGSGGVPVTYKRPADEPIKPYREYKFPRRQFSGRHRLENYLFYNKVLILRCQPCMVRVRRLTPSEVCSIAEVPGIERRKRAAELAAHRKRQQRRELAAGAMIIDSIDLCSSDDAEDMLNESGGENEFQKQLTNFLISYQSKNTPLSSSTRKDRDIDTILLEPDDEDVVPQIDVLPGDRNTRSSNHRRHSVNTSSAVHQGMQARPNDLIPTTMLSDSTLRLNQSLPTVAHGNGAEVLEGHLVRPLKLYANCSRTTVSVPGTTGTPIADANRLLKENRVNGWMQNAITHAVDGGNPSPMPTMAQSHTVLLATPISNGCALIGGMPVTFGNGTSGFQSHVGASVMQTLTTTTFINQTVHKQPLSVPRTGGPAATGITGATAANLQ